MTDLLARKPSFSWEAHCRHYRHFPIDVVIYKRDSFEIIEHRYEKQDLIEISNWWQERLRESVRLLPSKWINALFQEAIDDPSGNQTIPLISPGPP